MYDILELLVEGSSGLRLTECRVVHAGLIEGVPRKLSLGCTIVNLKVLLIAAGERGEGGLVAMRPILAVEPLVSAIQ